MKILPDFYDRFQQLSQNTKMLLLFFKISNLLYSQVHLNLHVDDHWFGYITKTGKTKSCYRFIREGRHCIPNLYALEIPGQEKWILSSTKKFQSGLPIW
jgi:hypothetical protein